MTQIKKGLDLPITGVPEQRISGEVTSRTVAVSCHDYPGLKPTMKVSLGDKVKRGDVLFADKKTEGVTICAPAGGTVTAIERGHRRFLESVVITVDPALDSAAIEGVTPTANLSTLTRSEVVETLVKSGLWSALRTRPFSKIPATDAECAAVFVTATDTNPLAADPQLFIKDHFDDFKAGLEVLTKFGAPVHLVSENGLNVNLQGVSEHQFTGKHPAGNVGTHIHFIRPVSRSKVVWHIGYSDVVSVGRLFSTGELMVERYVSVAGPEAKAPKIVKTRLGAELSSLTGTLSDDVRTISGSIWNGRTKTAQAAHLGRYHVQVSLLKEGFEREFMGWLNLGKNKFSVLNITLGSVFGSKKRSFTTSNNGSDRAMVPVGQYEKVMPLDILPTQLLRSILVGDIVQAMELGALELDEEDLALCTFVCSGKYEYGPILRDILERIEKET